MHLTYLLTFLLIVGYTESARILCYFAFPSVSHQNVFRNLWKALAQRGHEVVVLTPNPLKDSSLRNLVEIDLSSSYEIASASPLLRAFSVDNHYLRKQNNIFNLTSSILEYQFDLPQVKQFLADDSQKFDLVLVHTFFMPPLYALGHKYKAPVIGVISFGMPLQGHDSVGNPAHPVTHPDLLLNFGNHLTFCQRWMSSFYAVLYRINYQYSIIPKMDAMVKRYFGEDTPYLLDLEKNVSMQFMNVNPVLYSPRPNVPAVLELKQMHLNPVKPLPKDLQNILDNAKEGIIYFSLGSNVKSVNIGERLQKIIASSLAELPYKVLWKFEADHLPNKPENVITRKWFPQQDVLAHPNVKAFVTQGGLQSIEEAIANTVPLVGIPFLGDQPMNVVKLAEAGIAIALDKDTLTRDTLTNAITEAATNQKYRNRIKEVKEIMNDEPMRSLDKAVWWCEYVIRHKGARHLRSPALDIPLYQYFLLDVIGATILISLFILYVVYKIFCFISVLVFGKSKKLKTS